MQYKNIIFDLGGVILDIDYQKTVDAFRALGFEDFDLHYTQAQQSGVFDSFEIGAIQPSEFMNSLKNHLPKNVTEQQIIDAWNALLLDWNPQRIEFIKSLKGSYRLFLFSNTNVIHKVHFEFTYRKQIGKPAFNSLFEQAYYSHELGKRKPDAESLEHILKQHRLDATETLFIDDSIQHVQGARLAGIEAIHLQGQTIHDLDL